VERTRGSQFFAILYGRFLWEAPIPLMACESVAEQSEKCIFDGDIISKKYKLIGIILFIVYRNGNAN